MEENKLFNQIKSAAENEETKDFPGMEKVWNRVEEKLDTKEDKKAIGRWKKIAVAASLLLVATLGYQFFKSNPHDTEPNKAVTTIDSVQKNTTVNDIVNIESTKPNQTKLNPVIKKNAEQILQNQIVVSDQVAALELTPKAAQTLTEEDVNESTTETYKLTSDDVMTKANEGIYNSATLNNSGYLKNNSKTYHKKSDAKDVELFMDKSKSAKTNNARKEEPLVVIGDKAIKEKLENIEFSAADSLVVLNEPLYIINGVEYTEQQVFGPNPTSPYTPLNKQDIETISILQNEKAIEIYGDKGRKGVVIITIKKKTPANAEIKASKKAK